MIRVLVADDSVSVRKLVSSLLAEDPEIQVIGVAANGKLAVTKYEQLRPDVVTLDVEMPEMDGLQTLRAIRAKDPAAAVLMFSSLTRRGAQTTLDALAAGAIDYVAKPEGVFNAELMSGFGAMLIQRIKLAAAARNPRQLISARPAALPTPVRSAARPTVVRPADILAIASSTGGPNALAAMLPKLPKGIGMPVTIVQHMPEVFTKLLAERLNGMCQLPVHEGVHGEILEPDHIYVAPGGKHMEVMAHGNDVVIRLHEGPQENSCRPAADVLFRSVAQVYRGAVLGVVLTGMGQDGLRGSEVIRAAGGQILAQDEATSVVWGMPRAVTEAGLAAAVLPLDEIANEIQRRVKVHA